MKLLVTLRVQSGTGTGVQLAASSPILFTLELRVPLGDCSHAGWGLPFYALPFTFTDSRSFSEVFPWRFLVQ